MAESALSFVAGKLYNLLNEEATFLLEVSDQVEWMQRQLRLMQDFLNDADAKRRGNEVSNWLKEVREAAFDAEDVVDKYILNMHRYQKRRWIMRYACILQKLFIIHRGGVQIEQIKIRLSEISKSRTIYGINYNVGETQERAFIDATVKDRRELAIHRDMNYFVGFEQDMKKIIDMLLDEKVVRRCVVSIVGMGGSGKTTLARKICNNGEIRRDFGSYCALVSVSQNYTVRRILEDIAKVFLSKEQLSEIHANQFIEKICTFLESKKYLIVLDDIWDTEAWSLIQDYLPDKNNGSRVIITTRMMYVATFADPSTPPHMMNQLNDDESWDLFTKIAFPGDQEIGRVPNSDDLMQLGKAIVKKCGGLPLAVVVMGGFMYTKEKTPSVWRAVVEEIDWTEVRPQGSVSMHILGLSFDVLPHHLKTCFLYFTCFPEDSEIDAERLVRLWVAEGFVPREVGEMQGRGKCRTMEETAEFWLEELVQRCLVQAVEMSASNRVVCCRIHDLLLDLAVKKAKEVNFFLTCRESGEQARRFSLHSNGSGGLPPGQKVRTFVWINKDENISVSAVMEPVMRWKLLRVLDLDLHGSPDSVFVLPEAIGDLILLRYLGLSGRAPFKIPQSTGKLQSLQTLLVPDVEEVPNAVWKIGSLRHVVLGLSWVTPRENVGEYLVNLQTLLFVGAGRWIQKSLGMMTNLRCLGIVEIERSQHRSLSESLDCLVHLRRLALITIDSLPRKVLALPRHVHLEYIYLLSGLELMDEDPENQGGEEERRLVNYSGSELPPNINHIQLSNFTLQQDPLLLLGRLSCLRWLDLSNAYVGEEVVCSAGGFPQLEHMEISYMRHLRLWRMEDGAMPRLKYLEISYCRQLAALPDGLQHLKALHELRIHHMDDQFYRRLEEREGEDWHKIQHVPIVTLKE